MCKSFLHLSNSSVSFLRTATPPAMRFGPFMSKLQSLGYTVPYNSPFGICSRNYKQRIQLRVRNAGVSYALSGLRPGNGLCHWSLSNGIVPGSCDYLGISKRHFGIASSVEAVAEDSARYGNFNKLAAQSMSKVSDDVAEASPFGEHVDGEVKQVSSVSTAPVGDDKTKSSGKKKRQTRTKQKKDESSTAVASEEAATVAKSPKSTKRSSNSKSSKSGKSAQKAQESIGKKSEEALDDSALIQSSKKSGNARGKDTKVANKSEKIQNYQDTANRKPLAQLSLKPLYPPTVKSVMVVESVTKAKVIQGYLGDMFEVVPSYGHIRDLSPRSGSVRPNEDFSMVWEVLPASWTHLKSIKVALSGAENLILASDPDREGEAIAWHIIEMLQQQNALRKGINIARVVFNEITEASIKNALQCPREIDVNLVQAYLARRALDYLIGFNVSPLLWRKLPGCQSAGRVQSAALSLICDREMEIDEFKPQEYWSVEAALKGKEFGSLVNARLTHFDSKKLNQLSISSDTQASDIEQKINSETFLVLGSKTNKMKRNPPTPYITSTLQQDAASKLNFNASYTMKVAQKLYEGIRLSNGKAKGLITYIRTDGLHISDEAIEDIRSLILQRYGSEFASVTPRKYFKKVKNAQEAHEAIRPTDIQILPSMLVDVLDDDSLKLYTLIWARIVACQMEPATIEQIQAEVSNTSESIIFRTGSSKVDFLGFQAVYEDTEAKAIKYKEGDSDRQEACEALKLLKPGDPLLIEAVDLKQHFTQHPPRYSEASLVKKMEELGIGRPSTYASTLKLLQERNYVTMKNRALHPEFRGRMVSAFLSHHFTEVTDYSFTADMETELDNVSAGLTEWKGLLKDYWTRFSSYCTRAQNVHIHQVEKMLEKTFGDYLFGSLKHNDRACPSCKEGTLTFKVSRFGKGYFIGCDQHPKCKYIAKTLYGDEENDEDTPESETVADEPKVLGLHPDSGEKILLKNGPFGFYVQLGEDRNGYAPKRASLSHIKDVNSVTVEEATELLQYPVTLGNHPKDGQPVLLRLGKSGLTVKHRRSSAPVPKNTKREDVTLEKALKYLSGSNVKKIGRPKNKPKLEACGAV